MLGIVTDAGAVAICVTGEGGVGTRRHPHISSRLAILPTRPARIDSPSTGRSQERRGSLSPTHRGVSVSAQQQALVASAGRGPLLGQGAGAPQPPLESATGRDRRDRPSSRASRRARRGSGTANRFHHSCAVNVRLASESGKTREQDDRREGLKSFLNTNTRETLLSRARLEQRRHTQRGQKADGRAQPGAVPAPGPLSSSRPSLPIPRTRASSATSRRKSPRSPRGVPAAVARRP
jgi:hypothetical protein